MCGSAAVPKTRNQFACKILDYAKPYVTPISRVIANDEGELLGSGSYCEYFGNKYLITNEHVAKHMTHKPIAHQFFHSDNDYVIRLINQFLCIESPTDVAISLIDDSNWNICNHDALAIPVSRFAQRHEPVKGELLFFVGYSGERSKFFFGTLNSPATPYLTQETELPREWDKAEFHFALHYPPDLARRVDGSTLGLPNPHGFSGSLVWNTRRVECLQTGEEWTPECAQVTGIVQSWYSSNACIIATRVEHIREIWDTI
jgi:hypothetical protein